MPLKQSKPWMLKALAISVALTCLPATAQEQDPIAEDREIETTTVVATKTPQDLSFGLFNLTDKANVRWSDGVAIGSSDSPLRFSQLGLHAGLNLRLTL